MKTVAVFLLDN